MLTPCEDILRNNRSSFSSTELEQNDTRRNLLYVGHSMGTTMAFVMLASKPEYNDKIQAVFAMAPVAFMGHVKSPIRLLAPFSHDIEVSSLLR